MERENVADGEWTQEGYKESGGDERLVLNLTCREWEIKILVEHDAVAACRYDD